MPAASRRHRGIDSPPVSEAVSPRQFSESIRAGASAVVFIHRASFRLSAWPVPAAYRCCLVISDEASSRRLKREHERLRASGVFDLFALRLIRGIDRIMDSCNGLDLFRHQRGGFGRRR